MSGAGGSTRYQRASRAVLRGQPLLDGEVDVLDLVSRGLTNHQVGRVLGLAEGGVKDRLRKVMAKLGATDRAHAVRLGFEAGYLRQASDAGRVAS